MALKSKLFSGDPVFERCLKEDAGHVTPGSKGFHVAKIHDVLMKLDGFFPSKVELVNAFYGATTAAGVQSYKQKRKIINTNYQQAADNIVGKMTIAEMDSEMMALENRRRAQNGGFEA